jgi:hypothetical protein
MAETKARKIAGLIDNTGDVKTLHLDNVPNAVGIVGTQVYSSPSSLPTTGLSSGDQAFVTSNQRLYITNGAGWYNVAAINATPRFTTSPNATYDLSNDLSATVITMVAQDSDGQSVTYSATDSGMAGIATVSNDSGVFTITPLTDSAGGTVGTFTLTFTATDGIGIASVLSTFTLSFGPDWSSTPTLTAVTASDGASGDYFGESMDISGDGAYAIISASANDDTASASGSAYVYTVDGSSAFAQQAKLNSSDPTGNVYFGDTCKLNTDGTYAIIGARGETNASGTAVGAAYIFTRSGTSWSQQAKISPTSALDNGDHFGRPCAISGDGTYAAISATNYSHTAYQTGRVYIYTRSGTSWSQQAAIESPTVGTSAHQNFGQAIAINSDGTYLVASTLYTSKAWVFTRSGTSWSQQDELDYSDAYNTYDRFGGANHAIALSGNNYCIVGAHDEDGGAGDGTTDKGAAYVFTRSGSTWSQQAKLVASDGAAGAKFGYSVDFNSDATLAAVGARSATINGASGAGAIYVFSRDGTTWTQVAKLDRGSNAGVNNKTGQTCAIAPNGNFVISSVPYVTNGTTYVWDV